MLLRVFFDHGNPQANREIFAFRIAELPAQLFVIALFQHFDIQGHSSCKMLYVVSIALDVPLQLG